MLQSCTMPLACSVGMCRWLCRCLLPREICNQRLAVGATAKKANHAKKTQRQKGCGKSFSHDGSPIDSVQYSIRPMATLQMVVLSDRTPESTAASSQDALNVITIYTTLYNGGRLSAANRKVARSWAPGKAKPASQHWRTGVV